MKHVLTTSEIKTAILFSICLFAWSGGDFAGAQQVNPQVDDVRVKIDPSTTRITTPLDEAGYVDYLQAMNVDQFAGVAPEDNFALILWAVLGPESIPESDREAFFEPMSFDLDLKSDQPTLIDATTFLGDYRYASRQAKRKAQSMLKGKLKPWLPQDAPALASWLDKNQSPLETLSAGLTRSSFAQPYVCDEPPKVINSQLYGIERMKEIGRMFALRAMLGLGQGGLDRALTDALNCRRIGNLLTQRETIAEVGFGFEVCAWAAEVEHQILADPALTQAQAKTYLDAWLKMPDQRSPVELVDRSGRWSVLDIAQLFARYAGKPDAPETVRGMFANANNVDKIDFNESMRIINQWFDRGVQAVSAKTHDRVLNNVQAIYDDLGKLQSSLRDRTEKPDVGGQLGKIWITQMFPDLRGFYLSSERAQVGQHLTLTGYAIRLYEFQHNQLPQTLDELDEGFLTDKTHIMDPASGKPFHYEVQEDQATLSGADGQLLLQLKFSTSK